MKILLSVLAAALIVSCGTSRKVSSNSGTAVKEEFTECEEYAKKKPAQRAFGVGEHFQEITAKNIAELQARATLAKSLQSCIESTITDYAGGTTLFSADGSEGRSITDQTASINDRTVGIAKELIKGATVVKMEKFRTPNNQYKIYVCVEYSDDVAQIAEKVTKSFNEMLSADQKAQVKLDEQRFKAEMESKMINYKGITMQ